MIVKQQPQVSLFCFPTRIKQIVPAIISPIPPIIPVGEGPTNGLGVPKVKKIDIAAMPLSDPWAMAAGKKLLVRMARNEKNEPIKKQKKTIATIPPQGAEG